MKGCQQLVGFSLKTVLPPLEASTCQQYLSISLRKNKFKSQWYYNYNCTLWKMLAKQDFCFVTINVNMVQSSMILFSKSQILHSNSIFGIQTCLENWDLWFHVHLFQQICVCSVPGIVLSTRIKQTVQWAKHSSMHNFKNNYSCGRCCKKYMKLRAQNGEGIDTEELRESFQKK